MITRDLRRAIARAAGEQGYDTSIDPGLRPGGGPGRYSASIAFELAKTSGRESREIAAGLAAELAREPGVDEAAVTGGGYVTIAATPQAIAEVAERIAAAGQECASSDALRDRTFVAPPAAWHAAATWEEARELLAAELTARLAQAAGATVNAPGAAAGAAAGTAAGAAAGTATEVAAAIAYAGEDAVRFSLARAVPGRPVTIDPELIARQLPDNPAYAVRYAHARAASGVRWAVGLGAGRAGPRRPPADPGELALLDALSWLPERVATAARRARPDEFARYLEDVAGLTLAALTRPGGPRAAGSDRLALARATRAGLAAGLALLGVSAPDRL